MNDTERLVLLREILTHRYGINMEVAEVTLSAMLDLQIRALNNGGNVLTAEPVKKGSEEMKLTIISVRNNK